MAEITEGLIEKAAAGDHSAFEVLIFPYRNRMLRLAYRLMGNTEDAMDVVQDALFKAFRYLKSFDAERNLYNWLTGIIVNSCYDQLKKRKRRREKERELSLNGMEDISRTRLAEEFSGFNGHLMSCMDSLSAKERIVFILRDLDQLTIMESSEILRCSENSIKFSLCSARRKMRTNLVRFYPQFGSGRKT